MDYVASIDIGTTAAKGVLVDREAQMHHEASFPLTTRQEGGRVEQHPSEWWEAVLHIASQWTRAGIRPEQIVCISMSGQMQDLLAIDAAGEPLRPAILYSDARAQQEAERIAAVIGVDTMREVTGNHFDGTFPFAKLLWLKEREPDTYAGTAGVLFGSKDYIVRKLTGQSVTDPTTASTSGLFHVSRREWAGEWLSAVGLEAGLLPRITASHALAGTVTREAAQQTGWLEGTPVVAGVGDAGATTLGAGVTKEADVYSYLGTTGWLAVSTPRHAYREGGVFHLAHPADGLFIAIAPLLNAGNVHQWAVQTLAPQAGAEPEAESERYAAFERLAAGAERGEARSCSCRTCTASAARCRTRTPSGRSSACAPTRRRRSCAPPCSRASLLRSGR
ncbi:FGGY family carbohydrate kinase [Paenibacillus sp. TAB 01]|uniref:FGGY family carbohydrate kinase n=1 Tax=Paenibacillus sp. TAB 01 TaxID=3368988 RepID=UPI003751123F